MITGSIVDLVTPLLAGGLPDFEAVEALVDWHVGERSDALVVGGTRGQIAPRDVEDRRELLRRAVWQGDGRVPIIAGIGLGDTSDALEMVRIADEAGADALLLDLPATEGSSIDALLADVRTFSKATKLPLILRPSAIRSPQLPVAVVGQLAKTGGVSGFVEGSADSSRVRELLAASLPKDFALYSGHDASALESILQGFHGVVSVTANVAPSLVRDACAAASAGDRGGSEGWALRLRPLYEALMTETPATPVKWALVEMGRINEGLHAPTLPQSSDYSHLRRALRSAKVLG